MKPPTPASTKRRELRRERAARNGSLRLRAALWVLREASTLPGAMTMVGLAFLGSALVPLALEPFLIVLTTNLPHLWRRFAICFAVGSILGGVATYVLGYYFFATFGLAIVEFWGEEEAWQQTLAMAQGPWWLVPVGVVAVGPGPTKLVTMAAGAARVWFPSFFLVLVVGRLIRFFVVSWFARAFGRRMHRWYRAGRRRAVFLAAVGLAAVLVIAYFTARMIIF